ncbi:hypothetical protein V1264_004626 [Littorina saxatilis]
MERVMHVLMMTWWCLTSHSLASNPVTTSSWRQVTSEDLAVSGYEVWVRGRSKVECIRECNKYSHCTSFVFNVSSRTCYLQPVLDNTSNPAHLGQVYVNTEPECTIAKAPSSNGIIIWSHTLTSLKGTVTCYDDFINTTSDVIVQCNADGSWEREGRCSQRKWTEPPMTMFPMEVPVPVASGWSVCVNGTPTDDDRFTVELLSANDSQPLHADFRFKYNTSTELIFLGYKLDGEYTQGQGFPDFPFVVGQPFHLRVMVADNATFEVYVNDVIRATFPQHPELPPSDITAVNVRNNVTVTRLDLFCTV